MKKNLNSDGEKRKTARTVNWEKKSSQWVKRWIGEPTGERGKSRRRQAREEGREMTECRECKNQHRRWGGCGEKQYGQGKKGGMRTENRERGQKGEKAG